ncbi:MAG: hypothetical protein ACHQVS_02290 [Candidatus Babeliales bacterium]
MKLKNIVVFMLGVTGFAFAKETPDATVSSEVPVQENNSTQGHEPKNAGKSAKQEQPVNAPKPVKQKKKPQKDNKKTQHLQDNLVPLHAFTINKIVASIYTEEDSAIITQLDVERLTLQGEKRTLEEIIFEKLVFLDAKAHKVVPDEEAIDRYLQTVQRENNLTLDQLKMIFKSAGYTYEEGREQFAIMSTVNSMIDYKIRSRLIVPEKDIDAYYKAHPEMEEPRYYVEMAAVPWSSEYEGEEFKHRLILYAQGKKDFPDISWNEPFWISKIDIAEDKEFITQLKEGQISNPYEGVQGFELYRVKEIQPERLKPLEGDRYKEISDLLRRPRFEQLMTEYKKELFDNASIVYY